MAFFSALALIYTGLSAQAQAPSGPIYSTAPLNAPTFTGGVTIANGGLTINSGQLSALDIQAGSTNFLFWNARSVMTSPSNGVVMMQNNARTAAAKLQVGGVQSIGTTFSIAGCATTSALTGGATAGSFSTTAVGACAAVITMGDSLTATNGWSCHANNRTHATSANILVETASNTTTATLSGTTASGDVIDFACTAY